MMSPAASLTSLSTALSRSSNSPRYFAPAINDPRSSATIRLRRRFSGTSPVTIRCASPSTTAVLPTPGSPISTGLFFRRRFNTCTTRRISSSRPITGSNFPSRASSVRSFVYFSSARYCCSADAVSAVWPTRSSRTALISRSRVTPALRSASDIGSRDTPPLAISKCSTVTNSSPIRFASFSAPPNRTIRL